jgi:hypothetical protein
MRTELGSIYDNQTWTLEELPPGLKPINSQWIFKLKPRLDWFTSDQKGPSCGHGQSAKSWY